MNKESNHFATLAALQKCTGCLACIDACKHSAIKLLKRGEFFYPSIDTSICIGCKQCEKACPIVTPLLKNKAENIRVYGGWAKSNKLRAAGASGGFFAGLANTFINEHYGNVSVYGAKLDNNRVFHERITTLEEIAKIINSKYIQSNTQGVYSKVRDDLRNNMYVLFSGTPCQIAGLYGYLGRQMNNEKLLTVELICAGVLSPEALDIHLEMSKSPKIISFRSKIDGGMYSNSQCTTIDKNGTAFRFEKRNDDIFYRCFSSYILGRHSCMNCHFAELARVADITVGDFWGGDKEFSDYEKGVNVVLANNDKAKCFIQNSQDVVKYECSLEKAISGNPCLYSNYKFIQYHPLVVWPNLMRRLLPRKIWLSIVTNKNPWRYIWGFYRGLSKIYEKRNFKKIKEKYSYLFLR